jgi:hypothetical protein
MKPEYHIMTFGIQTGAIEAIARKLMPLFSAPSAEEDRGPPIGYYYVWKGPGWEMDLQYHFDPGPEGEEAFHPEWREFSILLGYDGSSALDVRQMLEALNEFGVKLVKHVVLDETTNEPVSQYHYNELGRLEHLARIRE